jgi:hypothetical protein
MPGNDGFGFDDDKSISPSWPKLVKQNPKQSVSGLQSRSRTFSVEYAQLLTKGNEFKTEIASGTEKGAEKQEKAGEICEHERVFIS